MCVCRRSWFSVNNSLHERLALLMFDDNQYLNEMQYVALLGGMQLIAFRLMLLSCVSVCLSVYFVCVCVCVCIPRLLTPGKRFEIETSFFK